MRLIGHRGARGEAPENTLGGFRHLRALGVRAVEFDIHVSADGELVVIHDAELSRTTSGHGLVRDHRAAELAALDACHQPAHKGFPRWPANEGVSTLAQVLAELTEFRHLELELKVQDAADEETVVAALPAFWREFALAGRARCTSFNPRLLHRLQQQAPELPRGFLVEDNFAGDIVQVALALGCAAIGPHASLLTPALVAQAHASGLWVSTWTVNDREQALALEAMGVDGLITDTPTLAKDWLNWSA
ncbi:MAG: glycerophosphodiester phosphodiesterase [Paraperlucidibaca sp.]